MNVYRNINVGTTGVVIRAGRANVYGYYFYNNAAAARVIRLYNMATAPDELETPVMSIPIPAGTAANLWSGSECSLDMFTLGLSIRASTGIADDDGGAPSANDVVVNIWYV